MAQQIQPKVSQTQQSTALVQQPVKATCCGPTCTDTNPERTKLLFGKKWWFWLIIVLVLTGIGFGTYFLLR